jgi:hypothetical protein
MGYAAAAVSDPKAEFEAKAIGAPAWWNRLWVLTCRAASSTAKGPPLSWHSLQVMVVLAELAIMSLPWTLRGDTHDSRHQTGLWCDNRHGFTR